MLKAIRNINLGYVIILTGFIGVVSGFSMIEESGEGRTLLCFDEGCIRVQAISNIIIGGLTIMLGLYMIFRKHKLKNRKK